MIDHDITANCFIKLQARSRCRMQKMRSLLAMFDTEKMLMIDQYSSL